MVLVRTIALLLLVLAPMAEAADAPPVTPLAAPLSLTPPVAARLYCHQRDILDRAGSRRIEFSSLVWTLADETLTLNLDSPHLFGTVSAALPLATKSPVARFEALNADERRRQEQAASVLLDAQPTGQSLRQGGPLFRRNRAEVVGRMLIATGDSSGKLVQAEDDSVVVFGQSEEGDRTTIAAGGMATARIDRNNLLIWTIVTLDPVSTLIEREDLVAELRNGNGDVTTRQTHALRCSRDDEATISWPDPPPMLGSRCGRPPPGEMRRNAGLGGCPPALADVSVSFAGRNAV